MQQPTQPSQKEEDQIISSQNLPQTSAVYSTSTEGKVFHYGLVSKREYYHNEQTKQTSKQSRVVSLDQGKKERFSSFERKITTEDLRPSKVFVSGSPGVRSFNINTESTEEFSKIRSRGGIVKFKKKGKYTNRNEIQKIIYIQQWWRYMLQKLYQTQTIISRRRSRNETETSIRIGNDEEIDDIGKYMSKTEAEEERYKTRTETTTKKLIKRDEIIKNIAKSQQNYTTNIKTIKIDKYVLKGKLKEIWKIENEMSKEESFNLKKIKETDNSESKYTKKTEYSRNQLLSQKQNNFFLKGKNDYKPNHIIQKEMNFYLNRLYDAKKYNLSLSEKRRIYEFPNEILKSFRISSFLIPYSKPSNFEGLIKVNKEINFDIRESKKIEYYDEKKIKELTNLIELKHYFKDLEEVQKVINLRIKPTYEQKSILRDENEELEENEEFENEKKITKTSVKTSKIKNKISDNNDILQLKIQKNEVTLTGKPRKWDNLEKKKECDIKIEEESKIKNNWNERCVEDNIEEFEVK